MYQSLLELMKMKPGILLAIALSSCFTSICSAQDSVQVQEPMVQEKKPARQIGELTSSLLAMQVSGSAAGPALPMLGATSSISWERYKDSFKYRIPESFERAVSKGNTSQ